MPAWSRWLLAPLHMLAVATGAKSFRDNPVLGSARLNRWGLHLGRKRLAQRLAAWRRRRLTPGIAAADREATLPSRISCRRRNSRRCGRNCWTGARRPENSPMAPA
jgi:hypothetical protein